MPRHSVARVARELAERGYNAEREAVTLLAGAEDPDEALGRAVEAAPNSALTLTVEHVRDAVREGDTPPDGNAAPGGTSTTDPDRTPGSSGHDSRGISATVGGVPNETKGSDAGSSMPSSGGTAVTIANDVTDRSTGTGEYSDFVDVFQDRYERLAGLLRPRVNHRPASSLSRMSGGESAAIIGMVNDVRSTTGGHRLVELEDPTGTFRCMVLKDREVVDVVEELLLDEVVAVEGRLADDGGVLFVDAIHFPDVPRTFQPHTADRHVQAALVSDVHVGSQEFLSDAWSRFAEWLHTDEAAAVEYLLIAGDMVEGVGVYPDQDEELSIVDIYDQYETFAEHLKDVPGSLEIVMIPGNHDAVRLAEPQPAFDEELRDVMSAHDARIHGNPSFVTLEGVTILMYHGVSLDEVIAELPADEATYDEPHHAMSHLLKKRHVAPQFGERTRVAPEERDYLVIEDVPDVFHSGHVHKLGTGRYHNVTVVNSGCWQAQTAFQKRVNIEPDAGFAPILDLDTLDVTIRKFT